MCMLSVYIELFSLTMCAKALKLPVPLEPRKCFAKQSDVRERARQGFLSTAEYNYTQKNGMINFWGSSKGLWWHRTVSANIGKDPNKLGDKWVTQGSMMLSMERAWAENWVPGIFLLAAVPADVVTLGKSLTLWRLIPVCKIGELDLISI